MVQNLENNKGKKKIKVIDRSTATTGIWWVLLQTYISLWRVGVGGPRVVCNNSGCNPTPTVPV